MMTFNPDTTIETERLILRFLREEDAGDIFESICGAKKRCKYYLYVHAEALAEVEARCREEIASAMAAKRYYMAVVLKETGKVAGVAVQASSEFDPELGVEIGYAFGEEYRGKGYATESMTAFIPFLAERGIHGFYSFHSSDNPESVRVMTKVKEIHKNLSISLM